MKENALGTPLEAPREVVLASAGAGKTFHISSRVITLLAYGEEPAEILGSTFTRKAAGQILQRVLGRMAEAALSAAAAAELAAHARLSSKPGVPAEPAFWSEQLEGIVGALNRVNLGTLDAFFVGVAQSFCHELGLPPGWRIADQQSAQRMRSQALQRVLSDAGPGELAELLELVNRGGIRRSIHDHLLDRLGELVETGARLDPAVEDPWSVFGAGGGEPPAKEERDKLAAELEDFRLPTTTAGSPSRRWEKAIRGASAALRAGDWEAFAGQTLCQRVLGEAPVFYGVAVEAGLRALLEQGLGLARRALGPSLAGQLAALGRLSGDFELAYREVQRREGAFSFDDITRLLAGSDPLGDRADLYYRLDARVKHILLDEFQDTSLAQWEALAPIVDEVLSDPGRAGVVVADPKQSIFGWRGGEPELVHAVAERYSLEERTLAVSWRSSPVVLRLVNRVFGHLTDCPIIQAKEAVTQVAECWARDFRPHQAAHPDRAGYVRVEAGPPDQARTSERPLLFRYAAQRIAELHRARPEASIGVLVRQNRGVSRMILELRTLGVAASAEGGTPLTDSAGCEAVLALLRLADHPGDSVARYHVAASPLAAARLSTRWLRRSLVERGYGATIDELVGELAAACDQRELRRLDQLVELAHRYQERATLRPGDFVRWVEQERVPDPASAAVRVMTVHQAKGLEFDAVVLPDLQRELFRERDPPPSVLTHRPHPAARPTVLYPCPPKAVRALFPELERAYRELSGSAIRDGLSALYVALTRARHALHVIVPADGEKGPGNSLTPARILREALASDPRELPRARERAVLYQDGEESWCGVTPPDGEARADTPTGESPLGIVLRSRGGRRRLLPRRPPSQLEGGGSVPVADLLRPGTGAALDRGAVIHAWLGEIGWLEDGIPADGELAAIALREAPAMSEKDLALLLERFRAWMTEPVTRGVLSRGSYPAGTTAQREVPFIHREGEVLMEGRIDRLVLTREGSRNVGAEIFDFKTDPVSLPALWKERAEHYKPQLRAYARAVAGMYRLPGESVRARLVFLAAAQVVEC
ncbi:MAG: UvrD-helicase domain-containing protein [Longimicrobiaceae bacterium]